MINNKRFLKQKNINYNNHNNNSSNRIKTMNLFASQNLNNLSNKLVLGLV